MKSIASIGLAIAVSTTLDINAQQGPGFGGGQQQGPGFGGQQRGFGGQQQGPGGLGRGPGGGRPSHPIATALDVNNNDILEAAEITDAQKNLLKLDRNKDGQLTSDETEPGPPGGQRGGRGFGGHKGGPPGANEQPRGADSGFGGPGEGQRRGNGGPPPHPLGTAIDANNNGTLEKDELAKASAALLKLDEDGDGSVSHYEMRPRHGFGGPGGGQRGGMGGQRGGQGNFGGPRGSQEGAGSGDQFGGPRGGQNFRGPQQSMQRGGQTGPGQGQPGRSGFGGGQPGGFGNNDRGGRGFGAPNAQSPQAGDEAVNRMMSLDKNADGRLTEEEIPTRLRGLMQADSNKDGVVTRVEATAYVNKLRNSRNSSRRPSSSTGSTGQRRPAFDE